MNNLVFEPQALADLTWWIRENKRMALRIMRLLEDVQRDPFQGLGKPEPLKHNLSGAWSRRIDKEHRLIYQVTESNIIIIGCKYHYR